jgi:hypothetical protein
MDLIVELREGNQIARVRHELDPLETPDSVRRNIFPVLLSEAIRQISTSNSVSTYPTLAVQKS